MHRIIVRRQSEHLCLAVASANPAQCLETAHAGHREIHHHHVGAVLEIELARGFAGIRLGDDRHLCHGLQQQAKSHSHHRVIVNQQDPNHVRPPKGMSAVRLTPRPSCSPILKVPPNCCTRSVNPRKPKCPGRAHSADKPTPSSVTVAMIRRASLCTTMSTREACACRTALIKPSWT